MCFRQSLQQQIRRLSKSSDTRLGTQRRNQQVSSGRYDTTRRARCEDRCLVKLSSALRLKTSGGAGRVALLEVVAIGQAHCNLPCSGQFLTSALNTRCQLREPAEFEDSNRRSTDLVAGTCLLRTAPVKLRLRFPAGRLDTLRADACQFGTITNSNWQLATMWVR